MIENEQKKKKKKGRIIATIVQLAIGAVFGAVMGYLGVGAIASRLFSGQFNITILFLFGLFIFMALFININIHEFGHFLCGKIFGYTLLSYRIGIFAWNYENGRMKLSIIKNRGYSGLCAMMPPDKELENYKSILFYSGGILLNIVSGIIFIGILSLSTNFSEITQLFFGTVGAIALLLGISNLLPFISGNNATDGKIIWSLILKNPYAMEFIEVNKVLSQLSAGVRPRDLQFPSIHKTENLNGHYMLMLLYRYFKALDSNHQDDMLYYAKVLENNIESFPEPSLPPLYYELCYMGCIFNDEDKATAYYKKAGKMLQKDNDANGLRIKAYYEFYINKNEKLAMEICKNALAVTDKFPIKGQGLMEKDLVIVLQNKIKVLDI